MADIKIVYDKLMTTYLLTINHTKYVKTCILFSQNQQKRIILVIRSKRAITAN